MTDRDVTAEQLDDAVRDVDGVVELYSSAPLVARVWDRARSRDTAQTTVTGEADSRSVTVSIGVTDRERAVDTARRAADAVRAQLGGSGASVTVRVSRVIADVPPEA